MRDNDPRDGGEGGALMPVFMATITGSVGGPGEEIWRNARMEE